MSEILIDLFRMKIKESSGHIFQDLVCNIFLIKYGNDFTFLKKFKDKGCDGIVKNIAVIAVYGPEKHDLKIFKDKIGDDYGKYEENWKHQYPKWWIIYNSEFTASMINFIDDLDRGAKKIDINNLIDIIRDFSYYDKRKLANILNIDDEYFSFDILHTVVDDLITWNKNQKKTDADFSHKPPSSFNEKVALNYTDEDVNGVITEYEQFLPKMSTLDVVLKGYNDMENKTLKQKIIRIFNQLEGDFKTKFEELTNILVDSRRRHDDVYIYHIRLVLFYMFEGCFIGKKPNVLVNRDINDKSST